MSEIQKIDSFSGKFLQFGLVEWVAEIFPSPIPEEINDMSIEDEFELFRMSNHLDFEELYIPEGDEILGECEGEEYKFDRYDFLKWQLSRVSNQTLYHLAGKTDASIKEIFDSEIEYEKDSNYDPETWLNFYDKSEGNYELGISYIKRLKNEVPDKFYEAMIEAILDPNFGLLAYLETEIEGNLEEVRDLYNEWVVPIMIVSEGKFFPYIEDGNNSRLLMDDYSLRRMYVRNYDEGDI